MSPFIVQYIKSHFGVKEQSCMIFRQSDRNQAIGVNNAKKHQNTFLHKLKTFHAKILGNETALI